MKIDSVEHVLFFLLGIFLFSVIFCTLLVYFNFASVSFTVSAQLERRGSIFQNGFLGEVLFEFNIPGVLIKKGLY